MAFPADELCVIVEIRPGGGDWVDVSARVRSDVSVGLGGKDETSTILAGACGFDLYNEDGELSPGHPLSPYWPHLDVAMPVRVRLPPGMVDPEHEARFHGEVTTWQPHWAQGVEDEARIWVEAHGILLRLGNDSEPLESPLRRSIRASGPAAYWSLEDGDGSTSAASEVADRLPMSRVGQVLFGRNDQIVGSAPLPDWVESTGALVGSVGGVGASSWMVGCVALAVGTNASPALTINVTGTPYERWHLVFSPTSVAVQRTDGDGNVTTPISVINLPADASRLVELRARQVGTSANIWLTVRGGTTSGTAFTGTIGRPTGVRVDRSVGGDVATLGHVAVWQGEQLLRGSTGPAMDGYADERARDRMIRLCAEEGIPLELVGDEQVAGDDFDRTEASGWGTAPSGQDWVITTDGGTIASSVTPGTATITRTTGTAADAIYALLDETAAGNDVEMLTSLAMTDATAGVVISDGAGTVRQWLLLLTGVGTGGAAIGAAVDGVTVGFLDSVQQILPGVTYWLRAQAVGATMRLKVWEDGSDEPAAWGLEATFDDAPAIIGAPGVTAGMEPTTGQLDVHHYELVTPVRSAPLGVQRRATLLTNLRDVAATDLGLLSEARNQLGLVYRPLADLYNQDAVLTLSAKSPDGESQGQIDADYAPKLDTALVRNDITVQQVEGGDSARLVQETGPRSVLPPGQGGIGRWPSSASTNAAEVAQLTNIGSWLRHLGTEQGLRLPVLPVDLAWSPDLIPTWAGVRLGDRIDLARLPRQGQPDLSILLTGYTETFSAADYLMRANAVPYDPYHVWVWDVSKWDTAGCELAAAADLTGTGPVVLDVVTTSGPGWTTDPDEWDELERGPLDLITGGVRVRVQDISPGVLDTFARTVAGGWGAADSGQTWQLTGGDADFDVTAGEGTISESTSFDGRWATLDLDYADVELLVTLTFEENAAGDAGLVARTGGSPDQDSYEFTLFAPASTDELHIARTVGGVFTTLVSTPFATVAGTTYWIRARCTGTLLLVKAWVDGDPEPAAWTLYTTDSSLASGGVGVEHFGDTGALTTSFAGFQLPYPAQQITATRVNDVPKIVAAGSPTRLASPRPWAL